MRVQEDNFTQCEKPTQDYSVFNHTAWSGGCSNEMEPLNKDCVFNFATALGYGILSAAALWLFGRLRFELQRRDTTGPFVLESLFFSALIGFSLMRCVLFVLLPLLPITWRQYWVVDGVTFVMGVFAKAVIVLMWAQLTLALRLEGRPLDCAIRATTLVFTIASLVVIAALVAVLVRNAESPDNPDSSLLVFMNSMSGLVLVGVVATGFASRTRLQESTNEQQAASRIGRCMFMFVGSFVSHFLVTLLIVAGIVPFNACVGFTILSCEFLLLDILPSLGVLYTFLGTLRDLEHDSSRMQRLLVQNEQ